MTQDEAHDSVLALVEDLRHVMASRPHENWPEMAAAVKDHHTPRISESRLTRSDQELQDGSFEALDGLIASDPDKIRAGIETVRTAEQRPRLIHSAPTRPVPRVALLETVTT